jgi:hypothetical protein
LPPIAVQICGIKFSNLQNMDSNYKSQGIPPNETGAAVNANKSVELKDVNEAQAFYKIVKQRVLDVNSWQKLAGKALASFELTNDKGEHLTRLAQQGDYFKIDIPGPGSKAGDGFDWVQIEELKEQNEADIESISIRVRPAKNPTGSSDDVSHFFDEESTSTFKTMREGNKITASIHDRNAKPNTDVDTITDKVRNAAVGTGAIGGFAKVQWQSLVDGLLKRDD